MQFTIEEYEVIIGAIDKQIEKEERLRAENTKSAQKMLDIPIYAAAEHFISEAKANKKRINALLDIEDKLSGYTGW